MPKFCTDITITGLPTGASYELEFRYDGNRTLPVDHIATIVIDKVRATSLLNELAGWLDYKLPEKK